MCFVLPTRICLKYDRCGFSLYYYALAPLAYNAHTHMTNSQETFVSQEKFDEMVKELEHLKTVRRYHPSTSDVEGWGLEVRN